MYRDERWDPDIYHPKNLSQRPPKAQKIAYFLLFCFLLSILIQVQTLLVRDTMGEQYVDNLKFPQLEKQPIKDALAQKEIITAQQKEKALYQDVLKKLSPTQIAGLIEKNFKDAKGVFKNYQEIEK